MLALRSIQFHKVALFDYVMTILCAFLITHFTDIPLTLVTICLLVLSIIFHFIFHINTVTNVYLKNLLN